jgi:tetratricopeptide (TPR) repeat protein
LKLVQFAVLCGWAGILLHSVVDFNMHIEGNAAIVCALIGLGLRRRKDQEEEDACETEAGQRWVNRVWPWVMVAVLGVWLYFWQVTVRTFFPLHEAKQLIGASQEEAAVSRAIELTKRSITVDPRNHHAAAFYGDLMRTQCSRSENMTYREKLSDISLNAYRHAIQLNPMDDTLLVRKAMMFDLVKKYPEARELYERAIRNQPHNGFFLNAMGNHYWRTGELGAALEMFERASRAPYGKQDAAKAIELLRPIVDILNMP